MNNFRTGTLGQFLNRDGPITAAAPVSPALSAMPFGVLQSPSLALGILRSRLKADGVSASPVTLPWITLLGRHGNL